MLLNAAGQPATQGPSQETKMVAAILLGGQMIFALERGDVWHFPAAIAKDQGLVPDIMPFLACFQDQQRIQRPGDEKILHRSHAIQRRYANAYHQFVTDMAARSGTLVSATPEAQQAIAGKQVP